MNDPAGTPHLLHVFSTFVPAGPEMRTVRMINALGDRYRHSILAIDGRTDAAAEFVPDAPVTILPSLPRTGTPQTVRALRRLYRELQPDLVLSYNWGAFDSVIVSRITGRGKRHLHHEDGFNADEAATFKGRREWARRLLLPGLARVIVPSRVLEAIATRRWRLAPEGVALVPNGIDLDAFAGESDGAPLRAELSIAANVPVIGFVGHLRPVKNVQRLLRTFAALDCQPAAHLVILGEGPERSGLEAAITARGLEERVHLVGHQSDTAPWYRLMDIFAISSDSEQMPVALLEAMASGLPVVSTDVGDVAHMLPDEQREFVVGGDEEASRESDLRRAFETLLRDPTARASLGRSNRERAQERYSFELMLGAYDELYRNALTR